MGVGTVGHGWDTWLSQLRGEVLLASSGQRLGMLLSIPQHIAQPPKRIIWPKRAIVPLLRNPVVNGPHSIQTAGTFSPSYDCLLHFMCNNHRLICVPDTVLGYVGA